MSQNTPLIGAHMPIAKGLASAIYEAEQLQASAIQIFLKNARAWKLKALQNFELQNWVEAKEKSSIRWFGAHASYLINLCSMRTSVTLKSIYGLVEEIQRADILGIPYLVVHPGSFGSKDENWGLQQVCLALDEVIDRTKQNPVYITLEWTADLNKSIGSKLSHFEYIFSQCKNPEKLRICLDTAHLFGAGIDIRNPAIYNQFFNDLDAAVGMHTLAVIHANDSKKELGSFKDRHEHLGEGLLGAKPFIMIMQDPNFLNIPKILETPKETEQSDAVNLNKLRKWARA